MITIKTQAYEYKDLIKPKNREILERVIYKYIETDDHFIYDEASKTVDEFCKFENIYTSKNSWLEPCFNKVDDSILKLSGVRLATWFLNNMDLYKPKYLKYFSEVKKHRMIKNKTAYSNIFKSSDYVLTGVYYDGELLKPIYDFISRPNDKTFEDIIIDCFLSLKKAIDSEIEYRQSEECILEEIQANQYIFYSNGALA